MTAVLEFECCRPVNGYAIVAFDQRKLSGLTLKADYTIEPPPDATDAERRVLALWGHLALSPDPGEQARVIHLLEPQSGPIECFDLFDSAPGLFLEFANTATTLQGVKRFADRYGSMSGGAYAEEIRHWYPPIRQMRRVFRAWDEAKATGNFKKIIRIIERRADYRSFARYTESQGIGADVLLKADPSGGPARLCIRPSDLLDALGIQLALAIDGNQNLRPCAECRTWFPVASGGHRSDKEYCSDACRMRAYRKRKGSKSRKRRG